MKIKLLSTSLTAFLLMLCIKTFAQIGTGINTTSPNGALDINSATQGLLIPRVALTGNNVAAPVTNPQGGSLVTGTIVYNTATASSGTTAVTPGFYYWNGTTWASFISETSTLEYGVYTTNAAQSITSFSQNVGFGTTIASSGGITYNSTNKTFTLPAGKTYRIDFNLGWINYAGTAKFARFALYNDTSGTKLSVSADSRAVNDSPKESNHCAFVHYITTTATTIICVRVAGGSTLSTTNKLILGDTINGTAYSSIAIQSIN